ncbi:MAG: hypothetical protein J6R79_03900 [Bacteroidaceae bacterium]|nr:hypothetical protein [Bacteroidaceae bacterium]
MKRTYSVEHKGTVLQVFSSFYEALEFTNSLVDEQGLDPDDFGLVSHVSLEK